MIESILSLICWVWLPALLVSLHHSEWRRQFGLYEWMSLCQRLGDGTDPTVMSLQRQGEERELLWDLPFIGLSPSLPLCTHPQFSCPVMGSCYKLVTHPPLPHSTATFMHPRCSYAIILSPALPCLFLRDSVPQSLAAAWKILISCLCSGAEVKKANLLVCMCVDMCVSVRLGLGRAVKVQSVSIPGGNIAVTVSRLSITDPVAWWE